MSSGPSTFRRNDVRRAIEAVEMTGKKIARVEVDKAGKITLIPADGDSPKSQESNPLDDWMTSRANPA